jgi:putative transferase (TIGR04331 family)
MGDRRVLVLTREHPSWNSDDDVVFLGPWCLAKPHEGIPRDLPTSKSFSVLPFHWNDRTKLRDDYDYLEDLHGRLLSSLAEALNRFHGTEYSRRYWQILLDPWLMAYVSVLFDRWEAIRLAMAEGGSYAVAEVEDAGQRRDFSFNDFTTRILSDCGNHQIWNDILRKVYPDRVTVFKTANSAAIISNATAGPDRKPASLRKVVGHIASLLGPLLDRLTSRSRFVLHQTMFDPLSLTRLSLALGQLPVFFYPALQFEEPRAATGNRSRETKRHLKLDFSPETSFESYLAHRFTEDLPGCVVEHFGNLERGAKKISLAPEVIVTAQSHWMNPVAKAWMADRVELGAKLVILEHGGSFPAKREFFDFEEDIADRKGTWFLPCHAKHVQVPPSKLLRHRKVARWNQRSEGKYCLIVGSEYPRYVYRAIFYPMADQCLKSLEMVRDLVGRLAPEVRANTKIRPYHVDSGWNTKAMYSEFFGNKMVVAQGTLDGAFVSARIITCTYPETTFTEAMMTGKPAILIYDPELNERHPATFELIELLRQAQIIFFDAAEAAAHVNSIWDDLQKWWGSPKVAAARRSFEEQACRVDGDWLKEWKEFLLNTGARAL